MYFLKQFRGFFKIAKAYIKRARFQKLKRLFHTELIKTKYAYHFHWLGVRILQEPQDLQAFQEIIWKVKPELIIETGIAYGGSLVFSASMLALLEATGEIKKGEVAGVDVDFSYEKYNPKAILTHPLSKKIIMIEGSSTDKKIVERIAEIAKGRKTLIFLDSNHTHEHVLAELKAYAPLVSKGSYLMVGDTGIEDLSKKLKQKWGKGNPKTAVWEFLKENKNFEIDKEIESRLVMTGMPDGYLRRIK